MSLDPVTLVGSHVRLEPMLPEHHPDLCAIGLEEELWRWTVNQCVSPEDMKRYMETAFEEARRGTSLPFVTIDTASGTVVGSTRFGNIDLKNKKVEIGWTWIGRRWQRTYINTEAKLLMLNHAFENLYCNRVELKTDRLNDKSRNAIRRLGASEEGTLRSHMLTDSGRRRDTVYYSILKEEWPEIEETLKQKLSDRS